MPANSSIRQLLARAFRSRSTSPIRKQTRQVGRHFEMLEDRVVPAVTRWVDNTPGSAGTAFTSSGGTQPANVPGLTPGVTIFSTISAAVAAASAGDTINVADGTYNELVTVTKTLTIQGNQFGVDARGRAATESLVSNTSTGYGDFQIEADNVTIDGFKLTGATTDPNVDPAALGAAIWTNPSFSATQGGHQILNNIVDSNFYGIFLNNTGTFPTVVNHNSFSNNDEVGVYSDVVLVNAQITNNSFSQSAFNDDSWAVAVEYSSSANNVVVSGNTANNFGRGFYFYNTDNLVVSNNDVLNTGPTHYGIGIFGGDDGVSITNNRVENGGRGIWFGDDVGSPNTGITVFENKLTGHSVAEIDIDAGSVTGTIAASFNYYGSSSAVTVNSKVNNPGGIPIDFTPFFNNDESLANQSVIGFQPDYSSLTVHPFGVQVGPTPRIQEGVNANTGPILYIATGAYTDGDATLPTGTLTLQGEVGATTSGKLTATLGAGGQTLTLTNLGITGVGSAITGYSTLKLTSTSATSGTVTVDVSSLPNTVTRTVDQPMASTTLTSISNLIVTAGTGAADTVVVNATNAGETFNVNTGGYVSAVGPVSANVGRVTYTSSLEQLTVNANDGNDTFNVAPDSTTKITLNGGNPTTAPGDTLNLNLAGVSGILFSIPALPNGSMTSDHALLSWTSIETFPIPLGTGGQFDFGETAAVADQQPGFYPVTPSDTVSNTSSGLYPLAGWVNAGQGAFNRLTQFGPSRDPNSPQLARLLRDGEWGNAGGGTNNGVFKVTVLQNVDIQVTVYAGDTYASRDNQNVYVSTNPAGPFTRLNPSTSTFNTNAQPYQFVSYSGVFNPGASSTIYVTFETAFGGSSAFWTVNGLDVRPVALVTPLSLQRNGGPLSTAVTSDGVTVDTYTGTGAAPNAELTVTAQYGTVLTADADSVVKGLQIIAAADGTFTFTLRRPLTTEDSLFTITDVVGASGTGLIGPTNGGTLAVSNDTYNSPPVPNAYLLPNPQIQNYQLPESPPPSPPGPPPPPQPTVQRFDFDTASSPTLGGFISVKTSDNYTATRGYGWLTGVTAYDRGTGGNPTALFEDGHSGLYNGTFSISVEPGASRDVRVYIGDSYNQWPSITVNTEGNPGGPAAMDPSLNWFGFVTLKSTDVNNDGKIDVTINSTGVWVISGMDVATLGDLPAPVSPAAPAFPGGQLRLDFDSSSIVTSAGFTSVRGNQIYSLGAAYGWPTTTNEFERTDASMPGTMTANQKALYRDGAWGNQSGMFVIGVQPRSTDTVRVYVGDSYINWPGITLSIEGGSSVATDTTATPFNGYVLTGTDLNGDGILTVSVVGQIWVMNGMDVVQSPNPLPALLQKAGFARQTQSTATAITASDLQPTIDEAIRRWVATGADAATLANVRFQIADLNGSGELGAASPGLVTIDDDAFGAGWFVDSTPGDDSEFSPTALPTQLRGKTGDAANRVDLLTVLMHELGHELGRDDVDGVAAPGDLMSETLIPGVRRLPSAVTAVPPTETGVVLTPYGAAVSTPVSATNEIASAGSASPTTVTLALPAAPAVTSLGSYFGEAAKLQLPISQKLADDSLAIGGIYLD